MKIESGDFPSAAAASSARGADDADAQADDDWEVTSDTTGDFGSRLEKLENTLRLEILETAATATTTCDDFNSRLEILEEKVQSILRSVTSAGIPLENTPEV